MDKTQIGEALPFGFEDTSFQAAGGIPGIKRLVRAFYRNVDTLPEAKDLRRLFKEDLSEAEEKLGRYLCGYLGGPDKYKSKYGSIKIGPAHRRHNITEEHAKAWLLCMNKAIDAQPYSEKFTLFLKSQFNTPIRKILDTQSEK